MKYLIIGVLLGGLQARAESKLHCSYQMYGTPVVEVSLQMRDDATPGENAEVTFQGAPPVAAPVTAVAAAADEKFHVWLAKDDPNGNLEMVVYKQPRSQGQSKLVNPQVPLGRELWGNCN